jgi:hypothetical protein
MQWRTRQRMARVVAAVILVAVALYFVLIFFPQTY